MSVGARLKAECCWSQKQLNHPVFTLCAWQLDGCQTPLHFCICTQFRRFGAQALLCMHVCVFASSFVRLLLIILSFFLGPTPNILCLISSHLRPYLITLSPLSSKNSPPPLDSSSLALSLCASYVIRFFFFLSPSS